MADPPALDDALLTPKDAAARLGLTPGTLEAYRRTGVGPPWVTTPGGRPRYRRSELDRYIAELPARRRTESPS